MLYTFNSIYRRLAQEYHIYLANVNRVIGRDYSLYQDYVHPNAMGYKLICYVWFNAIKDRLLIVGLVRINPSIDHTSIAFSLSQAGHMVINLYSVCGKFIKTMYDSYQNAGYRVISVPLVNLDPGIYIYSMQAGRRILSKKMIVSR